MEANRIAAQTAGGAAPGAAAARDGTQRWVIVGAGTVLQLCLGTVYAWSFFQSKIVTAFGWSHAATAAAFSLAIFTLGIAAAVGGILLPSIGPRRLAVAGAAAYGAGQVVAGLALRADSVPMFLLGYGLIGGAGLGLGYVTPVATVAKWFPDRRGLVTGMVVMGFGLGALLMSKFLAGALLDGFMAAAQAADPASAYRSALPQVFLAAGVMLGMLGTGAALLLRDPPGAAASASERPCAVEVFCAIRSKRFAVMWTALFCNVSAGIMFIAFQAPLLEHILAIAHPEMSAAALASAGAVLIGASAVCNGVGRLMWGSLSDRLGRACVFRLILGTQIAAFAALLATHDPWIFAALVCYVLLCYGGGFGTAPSLVGEAFGSRLMPVIYGTLLTAWSFAGVFGPQLVAVFKDRDPATAAAHAFTAGIVILSIGFVAALGMRDTRDVRS